MTGRLQLIEQKLLAIDGAGFQNLCDSYLFLREGEFVSFNRTGSQLGKQKTVKGTPDTFYRLANGSLGFVEYTTQADKLLKKVLEDIDKCLDEAKTGVPIGEIRKITICFNSRLETPEEAEIIKYAQSKRVGIELIGIDRLAIEICSKYLILAKDFLGIPIDTGQVQPIQRFVEEYSNKGGKLATPIDNIFLHRVKELEDIEQLLAEKNLLIIAGFPGVGKTKLGIEAIQRFTQANESFQAYAIAKKDVDIHDDLKILLEPDKDYILLVDDANRQLTNLLQILGLLGETRKGKLKLILTVRNYALEDISNICQEFPFKTIDVAKFSDEEIRQIISSDSFEIRNHKYQKKIEEISDGNARLAVMAARVAREQQQDFLFGDVSDLYDAYFERFLKDFDVAGDKILLKALGLVAFFFSIDRNHKEHFTNLLKNFGLDYYQFNDAIDELHKRELVEVQYDIVRISDQILATYIFYKVFIKEQALSYRTLLDNYFPYWKSRFRDTIIPANNSFGYESVLGKVDSVLNEYLSTIYADTEKVQEFFSLFWFYKPLETLVYFQKQIKDLAEPAESVFEASYTDNQFSYGRNKTLEFLANLFQHNTDNLVPALELSFEYCRKNPSDLSDLVKHIADKFQFDEDDEATHFERQRKLFHLLRTKVSVGEPHYTAAFFALTKVFMSRHFHVTRGGRKHSIVFYQYPLPFIPAITDFRKTQWEFLSEMFEKYPAEVFQILMSYKPHFRDDRSEHNDLLAFDLTLLILLIEQKLSPGNFRHTHFVHFLVSWLNREELTDRSYQKLSALFTTTQYEDFLKLDWDQHRDKEVYDFDSYQEYVVIKTNELRGAFSFTDRNEFEHLQTAIDNAISVKENLHTLSESIDVIIEENFNLSNELGFELFATLINKYPRNVGMLRRSIKAINAQPEYATRLYQLLKKIDDPNRTSWLLTYFDLMPPSSVDAAKVEELLKVIESIEGQTGVWFETFEKFEAVDDKIFEKILAILVDRMERKKCVIRLWYDFFEKYAGRFSKNFDLLGKAYLQQQEIELHGDSTRDGLKLLVSIEPKFLTSYVDRMYVQNEEHKRNSQNQLGFVWDLGIDESLIEDAINSIVDANRYLGILEHPAGIFFFNLTDKQVEKAKPFILRYISKYSANAEKMNSIFDAIRHYLKPFHEQAFHHFLSHNHDVQFFKEIWWRGNGGGVHSGDVNFGELEQADWINILNSLERYPNQLDVLEIKSHVKKEIAWAIKRAESERQRKFANPEYPF